MIPPPALTLPRHLRLSGDVTYARVMQAKGKVNQSGFSLATAPNALSKDRLGFSCRRGVGSSVKRHRLRRLLKEAFRLNQRISMDPGLDVVIIIHPHAEKKLADYQTLLQQAMEQARILWKNRANQAGGQPTHHPLSAADGSDTPFSTPRRTGRPPPHFPSK